MSNWPRVPWTQARQILSLMDDEREDLPAPEITPDVYFAQLVDTGRRDEAVRFLGHALPRYEAVRWAAVEVTQIDPAPAPPRRTAREAIARWIREVDDASRRVAFEAASEAHNNPEQLLGQAIFFSGGSIAPPDLPAVHPAPELTGRLAAAAILVAAHRSADATACLDRAITQGAAMAQGVKR